MTSKTTHAGSKQTEPQSAIALATVIQVQAPTSGKPGDKALISEHGIVDGWIGGGCVQSAVLQAAKTSVDTGEPCLLRVAPDGQWEPVSGISDYTSGCLGGGSLLVFVEPLHVNPTLCIVGDSPVAISLAEQAVHMNLNVTLCTPANADLSVSPTITVQSGFEALKADYIVIATQGKQDRKAIHAALQSSCKHIRMVVSARKLDALKKQLAEQGVDEQALARLEGPAGVRIGAQLTAEIALSVLAEIIQLRRTHNAADDISESKEVLSRTISAAPAEGKSCCGG